LEVNKCNPTIRPAKRAGEKMYREYLRKVASKEKRNITEQKYGYYLYIVILYNLC
jgi:hypothetical protein